MDKSYEAALAKSIFVRLFLGNLVVIGGVRARGWGADVVWQRWVIRNVAFDLLLEVAPARFSAEEKTHV